VQHQPDHLSPQGPGARDHPSGYACADCHGHAGRRVIQPGIVESQAARVVPLDAGPHREHPPQARLQTAACPSGPSSAPRPHHQQTRTIVT
jgi:hypothetical protein